MTKTTKIAGFMTLALLIVPAVSSAKTFLYVDTTGALMKMEADNALQALATAPNLAVHSGVMEVDADYEKPSTTVTTPSTPTTTGSGNYYLYVDTNGDLKGVWANSASEALATAPNLGVHSGVMLASAME